MNRTTAGHKYVSAIAPTNASADEFALSRFHDVHSRSTSLYARCADLDAAGGRSSKR